MAKMKVFVADSIAKEGIAEFGRFPELELVVKTGLPPAELAAALGDAAGLVVRSATQASRQVIEAGKALKVIGRAVPVSTTSMSLPPRRGGSSC